MPSRSCTTWRRARGARSRGATHQFGDRALWSVLDEASARGVDARLWLGSPALPEWRDPSAPAPPWLRRVPAAQGWEAHGKLLVADDETLLWGSGNFTSNGLSRSTEAFFRTRDPRLVAAARSYLATLGGLAGATPRAQGGVVRGEGDAWALLAPLEAHQLMSRHPRSAGFLADAATRPLDSTSASEPLFFRVPQPVAGCLARQRIDGQQPLVQGARALEACLTN